MKLKRIVNLRRGDALLGKDGKISGVVLEGAIYTANRGWVWVKTSNTPIYAHQDTLVKVA